MPFKRKALLQTAGMPHPVLLAEAPTPLELIAVPSGDPPWQKIRDDWGAHQVGATIDPTVPVGGMDLTQPMTKGALFACFQGMGKLKCTFNFGGSAFGLAAPSGYSAWGNTTTLDPAKTSSNMVLSGGNLTVDSTGSPFTDGGQSPSTTSHSSGKWYFEVTIIACDPSAGTSDDEGIGFTATPQKISPPIPWQGSTQDPLQLGYDSFSVNFVMDSGFVIWRTFGLNRLPVTMANGDVWGFAVDLDHKRFFLRRQADGAAAWRPADTSCAFMQFKWANMANTNGVFLDLQQGTYDLGHSPGRLFINGFKKLSIWGYGATFVPSFDGADPTIGGFSNLRQDINGTGRLNTVHPGDTNVTLLYDRDVGKFRIGDWCLLCDFELQGQAGYPPNHQNCEYVRIRDLSGRSIFLEHPVVGLSGPYVTTAPDHGVNQQPVVGTGAGSFGFAPLRLIVPTNASFANNDVCIVSGVTGTVEANGTWNTFIPDSTGIHVDLSGAPPFVHPWTGGGTALDIFTYDVAGPAALINVSAANLPSPILGAEDGAFEIELEIYGLTVQSAGFQTEFAGGAGKYTLYVGCFFINATPVPSMCKHWIARYCEFNFNAGQIELDKECEVVEFDGCKIRSIAGQSASIQNLIFKNCIVDQYGAGISGTPKNCSIINTTFPLLVIGCKGYGQSKTLTISNCSTTIALYDNNGTLFNINPILTQTADTTTLTYANGVFTSPPGSVLNPVVPGLASYGGQGNAMWAFGFRVVDVQDDGTNTETVKIITDIPPSHPFYNTLPALTPTFMWFSGIPGPQIRWCACESITVTNSTSHDGVLDDMSHPDAAGLPYGTYVNRTVSGHLIGGANNLFGPGTGITLHAFGRLVSITIDVQRAYTGAQASCLWRSGGGDLWIHVNPDVSGYDIVFSLITNVNLKVAGKRVITPTSVTGLQSGDDIAVPGNITFVGINFIPLIDCDMSADTDAQSPIVNFIIKTDQSSQFS